VAAVADVTRSSFDADGVVCLRGLVSADVVEDLRRVCSQARSSGGGETGFWNVSNLWRADPVVREILSDERVAGTLACLLGSRSLWLFEETMLVKEAGSTDPTPWHQDLTHYPLAGSTIATMWISLDAVAPNGGRVVYVRGSHRWGRNFSSVAFSTGEVYDAPGLEPVPEDIREGRSPLLTSFATAPGDCVVHHGLTLHGAPGNESDSTRRALAISVFGDDVRYHPPVLPVEHASEAALREGRPLGEIFPRLWPEPRWPD
jgi:ectoine hydroxylase-related dioxygenase (phytanoyl-CoA dioxygenase family)